MSAPESLSYSDRGFKRFAPIAASPQHYPGQVSVYESSAASWPHIWIKVESDDVEATVHLSIEDAAVLRDQIDYLIRNHYQLDEPEPDLREALRALIEKWRSSDYPDGLSVTAGVGYRAARWVCADELERAIGGGE